MDRLLFILAIVIAYFLGNISPSILLGRAMGVDIKKEGSGNAGTTNALRVLGKKAAVITLIVDIGKGVIAVLLGNVLAGPEAAMYCALAAFAGHVWPAMFHFKGGKGVATSLGVVLLLDWRIGVTVLVVALLIMVLTRYVSLGSVAAAVVFMALQIADMIITGEFNAVRLVCVLVLGFLLIIRHHANISRLLKGTENKLGGKKKEETA